MVHGDEEHDAAQVDLPEDPESQRSGGRHPNHGSDSRSRRQNVHGRGRLGPCLQRVQRELPGLPRSWEHEVNSQVLPPPDYYSARLICKTTVQGKGRAEVRRSSQHARALGDQPFQRERGPRVPGRK